MFFQSSYSSTSSVCSAAENTVLILFWLSALSLALSLFRSSFLKPAGSAPCRTHCHHRPPGGITFWLLHACFNLGHLALCRHTQTSRCVDVRVLPAVVGVTGMPGKTSPSLFPLLVTIEPRAVACKSSKLLNLNVHWKLPCALLETRQFEVNTRSTEPFIKVSATKLPQEKNILIRNWRKISKYLLHSSSSSSNNSRFKNKYGKNK